MVKLLGVLVRKGVTGFCYGNIWERKYVMTRITKQPTNNLQKHSLCTFLFFSSHLSSRKHWAIWCCSRILEGAWYFGVCLDRINAPFKYRPVLMDVSTAANFAFPNCNYPHKVLTREEIIPLLSPHPQLFIQLNSILAESSARDNKILLKLRRNCSTTEF